MTTWCNECQAYTPRDAGGHCCDCAGEALAWRRPELEDSTAKRRRAWVRPAVRLPEPTAPTRPEGMGQRRSQRARGRR